MKKKKLQYGYNMGTNKYKTEKSSKYGKKNKYITEKSTYEEMWKLCKCVQKFKNLKTQNMRHAFKTDLQM